MATKHDPMRSTTSAPADDTSGSEHVIPEISDMAEAPRLEQREERIRMAAYARYVRRDFEDGHQEEDWLAAESEIDDAPTAQHE